MVSSTYDVVNLTQNFMAEMDWIAPTVVASIGWVLRNIYKRMKVDMTLTLKLSTEKDVE